MSIIQSMLDSDLYKFSMAQIVLHRFPQAEVEFTFRCRNKGIDFSYAFDEIRREIDALANVVLTDKEAEYLGTRGFFTPDFIRFLKMYRFDPSCVDMWLDGEKNLQMKIRGPWLHTILFEVPILAIINEVYFKEFGKHRSIKASERENILCKKLSFLGDHNTVYLGDDAGSEAYFRFAEFGTRRRWSREWQDYIVGQLLRHGRGTLVGTSNVYLAMKYRISPIGTMAHEYLQAGQALGVQLVDSQKFMLEQWVQEYRGDLGIALTDVIGVDVFLRDFDLYFAKLYDGVRHDSGDPVDFGNKIIAHYDKLDIDPRTKTIVFSDGLSLQSAWDLFEKFAGRIGVSFGIGTDLTNDVGHDPLNIVMKMTRCNGKPVAKISDSPGKGMCEDDEYVAYLKKVYGV